MILLVFCFIPTHLLKKEFPPVQFKIWTPLHFNFAFDVFFVLFLLTKLALVASHMLLSNIFCASNVAPKPRWSRKAFLFSSEKHYFCAKRQIVTLCLSDVEISILEKLSSTLFLCKNPFL